MIPVEEAQERVLAEVQLLGTEQVVFTDALGRVLREDVRARFDVPRGDNTAMDGYAVRADDIANPPVSLRVVENLPAGTVAKKRVEAGTAIRIMTGALMPDGADTVAHVEITDAGSEIVIVNESLSRGTNIRRRGEDMHAGDVVLADGTRFMPRGWRAGRCAEAGHPRRTAAERGHPLHRRRDHRRRRRDGIRQGRQLELLLARGARA